MYVSDILFPYTFLLTSEKVTGCHRQSIVVEITDMPVVAYLLAVILECKARHLYPGRDFESEYLSQNLHPLLPNLAV